MTHEESIQQAKVEGILAKKAGLTEHDNPYYQHTEQHDVWLDNFRKA